MAGAHQPAQQGARRPPARALTAPGAARGRPVLRVGGAGGGSAAGAAARRQGVRGLPAALLAPGGAAEGAAPAQVDARLRARRPVRQAHLGVQGAAHRLPPALHQPRGAGGRPGRGQGAGRAGGEPRRRPAPARRHRDQDGRHAGCGHLRLGTTQLGVQRQGGPVAHPQLGPVHHLRYSKGRDGGRVQGRVDAQRSGRPQGEKVWRGGAQGAGW
mmetsp:Transcript_11820/g.38923  ORF Transcript_11820/g.38923 Transcript_11820/m.38923 type:complete len:214 (+) Transcript_11820:851-1492(+)